MKSAKLLLALIMLLCIPLVYGTIVHTTLTPIDLFQTTGSSVMFNWTATTSGSVTVIPSYLFITEYGNESNYIQNQTIRYITNGTNYNLSVSGFVKPAYYQWKVRSGDAATHPVMTSSNAYPYNTSDGNNTLNFNYTVNGTFEQCTVTLPLTEALNASTIVANFSDASCNFTATNTSVIILTGTGYGIDEYILLDSGNASTKLGFSGKESGTQTNYTSSPRWFEIQSTATTGNLSYFRWKNDSGFEAMRLNKDTGDLLVAGGINASSLNLTGDLDINGNLTLGQKITFALGEIIDNIVDTIISITGNLKVAGYVTSHNWTNVSIAESQILNYSANASADHSAYINATIGIYNTSVIAYVDAQDLANNNSLVDYIGNNNDTQNAYSEATYVNADGDDITGNMNFTGHNIGQINQLTSANISTNMTWTDLYGYPVACPSGSAITQLGDSVTCTVLGGVVTDFTNNVNFTGHNLTNVSHIIGSGANPVTIGDAGVANVVSADDDLFVSGKLEVNGLSYFNTNLNVTGNVRATDYYSGDGSQGITDASSYWLCTQADCSAKCQVIIKDGLITGCT